MAGQFRLYGSLGDENSLIVIKYFGKIACMLSSRKIIIRENASYNYISDFNPY